ncbi:MAG: SCP-2 sterol transfer family protein [Promethearchaeota archaeon]|nr:MAG: SCP-2 sterol transfer family protein [Candidatus Lokiarchaeota archaeon]
MVDAELIKQLIELRDKEKREAKDALTLFGIYKELVKDIEEVKEELDDMDEIIIQNNYTDADFKYWVKLGNGKFDVGQGEASDPSVIMNADTETWSGLGSGDIDATSAYMAGDLSIEGNLQDAMAYGEVLDLIRDFIEDLEE